ncbi:RimK-like ATPgrasp N-terminal domain-containing protein [Lacisediminimonas profundi]|uniref:RimK-like ATPgrasp N-terminal domain-containing protein n=1 Tax=Lacisediminimonas profundi TaxID=2603856 RepID=UPI00124B1F80|nr:RimK-like ATPgrasp N-terminal domain-containing protein [Lacisediminimonas profundi]
MKTLLVVSDQRDWPVTIRGLQVVTACRYLTEPAYTYCSDTRVFNLSHCMRYQSFGYYVSMLAEARGHRPVPDIGAIEDMHAGGMPAAIPGSLDTRCCHRREPVEMPTLAILRTPGGAAMPSNSAAIRKFMQAADDMGMRAEVLTRGQSGRIAEFDALFIRDTTRLNHYTYRIARHAENAGLVVMDDPDSIIRCSNKLFLHELLTRHAIPTPKTLLVHRGNLDQVMPALGVPCILKQPDSAFSLGVVKVRTPQELRDRATTLFANSELLLAQEYLPTDFDWRIGILDHRLLFACRYHMAPGHWQVIKHEGDSRYSEGLAEAVPLDQVPPDVVSLALAAASLIGDGFYGVDLKQRGGQSYVIEVNDNPNVDAGNEDGVLGDALYRQVVGVIRARIEAGTGWLS